jgi:hypothetical protein
MSEDNLEKFVENMRAAGQSDQFIMESLIAAGHNELIVLNLLDKERLDMFEDEETEENSSVESNLPLLDANGNPLIDPNNPPIAIGEQPATAPAVETAEESPSQPTRLQPRTYPRPATRPVKRTPYQPIASKEEHQNGTTQEPTAEENNNPESTIDSPSYTAQRHVMSASTLHAHVGIKTTQRPQTHSYQDYMDRIESHDEIEAGTDYALPEHEEEPGHTSTETKPETEETIASNTDEPHDVAQEEESSEIEDEDTPVPAPLPPAEELEVIPDAPEEPEAEEVEDLLKNQAEAAKEQPTGPEMEDLIDKKVTEELKSIDAPKVADKEVIPVPTQPQISRVARFVDNLQHNIWITVFILLILVGALVLVAINVMRKVGV